MSCRGYATVDDLRAAEVRLDSVELGDDAVLGDPAGGYALLDWLLDRAALAGCASMPTSGPIREAGQGNAADQPASDSLVRVFANPPQANRVVRTASIWTADDLAPLLDELATWTREAGRNPLDVHFGVVGGGTPGAPDFDPGHHRDQADALAAIGVTWIGAGALGDDLPSVLTGIEVYGREVIGT